MNILGAFAAAIFLIPVAVAAERPNILWLILDDINPDLGCYGNRLVKTPALDDLANHGMLFERAYAAVPVCSPSRSAFFTGNYASTINCHQHRSFIGKLPDGYRSVPDLLEEAGYFTVNIKAKGGNKQKLILGSSGKTDLNWDPNPELHLHLHMFDAMDPKTIFSGDVWQKRKAGQPFFAYVNIETAKAYGFTAGRKWAEANGCAVKPQDVPLPPYLADTPEVRREVASYYDAVSHTDTVINRFLTGLKQSGQATNTFVLFAADHGRATMRHKQTLYETGLHVPLILRWPGKIKPGTRINALASLIDLAPTTLAAAGVPIPANIEGLNLLSPQIKQRTHIFATRDRMDEAFDRSRAVITKDFKYIRHYHPEIPYINGNYANKRLCYKSMKDLLAQGKLTSAQAAFLAKRKPREELYRLSIDPFESTNLATNPEYVREMKRLRSLLDGWEKSSDDKGRLPKGQQPDRRKKAMRLKKMQVNN